MTTGRYRLDPGELGRHVRHLIRGQVITDAGLAIPLTVQAGQVIFNESTAPRAVARLSCHVDPALVEHFDPRAGAQLELDAGYVDGAGQDDVQPLLRVPARGKRVDRSPGRATLQLLAAGLESAIIDAHSDGLADVPVAAGSVQAQLVTLLRSTDAGTDQTPVDVSGPDFQLLAADLPKSRDRWAVIDQLADLAGLDVYDNGLGRFVIEQRPTVAGVSRHIIRAGRNVSDSSSDTSKDDGWANRVEVAYAWRDGSGADQLVTATASTTSGPYAGPPWRRVVHRRPGPATQAGADASARELLARALSRGRQIRLETPAPYWLRPGHTVSAQLATGDQARALVSSITFQLGTGLADLVLRHPDDSTIQIGA